MKDQLGNDFTYSFLVIPHAVDPVVRTTPREFLLELLQLMLQQKKSLLRLFSQPLLGIALDTYRVRSLPRHPSRHELGV